MEFQENFSSKHRVRPGNRYRELTLHRLGRQIGFCPCFRFRSSSFPMAKLFTTTHSIGYRQASVFLRIFEHIEVLRKFWDKIELYCGLGRRQFYYLYPGRSPFLPKNLLLLKIEFSYQQTSSQSRHCKTSIYFLNRDTSWTGFTYQPVLTLMSDVGV